MVSDKKFIKVFKIYKENKPHPLVSMFFDKSRLLKILVESHQGNIFAKLYWNRSSGFWQENFLSFLHRYIGKISPTHWEPCFLMNHDGLNNLDRGLHKTHSCNVIIKSVQWFLTRRLFKISLKLYGENKPRPLAAMFFDESKWLKQSW